MPPGPALHLLPPLHRTAWFATNAQENQARRRNSTEALPGWGGSIRGNGPNAGTQLARRCQLLD